MLNIHDTVFSTSEKQLYQIIHIIMQIVYPYSRRRADGYAVFMVCQQNANLELKCISNFTNYFCVQSVTLLSTIEWVWCSGFLPFHQQICMLGLSLSACNQHDIAQCVSLYFCLQEIDNGRLADTDTFFDYVELIKKPLKVLLITHK